MAEPPGARTEELRPAESDAQGYGVSPAELRTWYPLSAFEIHLARGAATPDGVRDWVRLGATVTEALDALREGLTPDGVREWLCEGFCPKDAVDAHRERIPLEVARDWRAAGFILPDALLLLREGWSLAAATAQRYVDVWRNPVGRPPGARWRVAR